MRGRHLTWQRRSGNFPGEGALGGAGSWCRETEAAQVCAGAGLSVLSRPAWQRRCGLGLRLTRSSQCILATGAVGEFVWGGTRSACSELAVLGGDRAGRDRRGQGDLQRLP